MVKIECSICLTGTYKKDLKKEKQPNKKGKHPIEPFICKPCWDTAQNQEKYHESSAFSTFEPDGFIDCDVSDDDEISDLTSFSPQTNEQFNPITDELSDDETETEVVETETEVVDDNQSCASNETQAFDEDDYESYDNGYKNGYAQAVKDLKAEYSLKKKPVKKSPVKKSPKSTSPKASPKPAVMCDVTGLKIRTLTSFKFSNNDAYSAQIGPNKVNIIRFISKDGKTMIEYCPFAICKTNEKVRNYLDNSAWYQKSGSWGDSRKQLPKNWGFIEGEDYFTYEVDSIYRNCPENKKTLKRWKKIADKYEKTEK